MKNPLYKRIPREWRHDGTKYIIIFLFMTLVTGLVSGFLVASNSMIKAYDESFEKYNIEDGHFQSERELTDTVIKNLEKENIDIGELFYIDVETRVTGDRDANIRIFKNRKQVNKVCVMEGELPEKPDEIGLDRMFAENNGLTVGDTILAGSRKLTICGLVALSDYSALFSRNSDMMFDATKFAVAVVTEETFETLNLEKQIFCYTWKYANQPADEVAEKEKADALMQNMAKSVLLKDFVPRYINQAIRFTGEDMGGDTQMMITFLYVLILIMGFVFSVTIGHTIVREANVIGTLRAMGYAKAEIVRHYALSPVLVNLLAAFMGNILGYTFFKDVMAALYYHSYSLPTFEVVWDAKAFVLTTVVPLLLLGLIIVFSLSWKLRLSPLKFIRRDLGSERKHRAVRLPAIRFFARFRLRIILQNKSSYLILFVGIFFASFLLLFGLVLGPLLTHNEETILKNMLAEYQYVLKGKAPVTQEGAETYASDSLKYRRKDDSFESITVFGLQRDSVYLRESLPADGVAISDGFSKKYGLEAGDEVTLRESYGTKEYCLRIEKIIEYPASLAVFMRLGNYIETFDKPVGYYTGYLSHTELTELKEEQVAACITREDLTKLSRQLRVSMGGFFQWIKWFAIVLAALLIYLLTKIILEKNTTPISLVKILGYENGEIGSLYLLATGWAVVVCTVVSIVLVVAVLKKVFNIFMAGYSGYFEPYITPEIYLEMLVMLLGAFFIVAALQFRNIQRISLNEALKNVE